MTISIRLNAEDEKLIRQYAADKGKSVSSIVRDAVLERIEDEYDLRMAEAALEEFEKNPVTYSHAEVKKMFGIE